MPSTSTTVVQPSTKPSAHIVPEGFERRVLQTFDVPRTNYESTIVHAVLKPNATTGRHQHPGIESGFVTAGDGTMFAAGQAPIALKAGQTYRLPFAAKHEMKSGSHGMTVVAMWILEKGKPIATT